MQFLFALILFLIVVLINALFATAVGLGLGYTLDAYEVAHPIPLLSGLAVWFLIMFRW